MTKKILKISLVGKTNAGKSTLINNILGETISITSKKINTTEELVMGIINIKQVQLIFYDTPGLNFIRETKLLNRKIKKNLWEGLNQSDIILYLIDCKNYNYDEINNFLNKIKELNKKIFIVFNKNDLIDKKDLLPKINNINRTHYIQEFFNISAKKNNGITYLINKLTKFSYPSNWIYNDNEITNKDDIFITNECTRKAILQVLHKEIPYNISVCNKIFKYLKNGDLKIKQEIKINNIRYKKIILGKEGLKIKQIRILSQENINNILKVNSHLYINIVTNE